MGRPPNSSRTGGSTSTSSPHSRASADSSRTVSEVALGTAMTRVVAPCFAATAARSCAGAAHPHPGEVQPGLARVVVEQGHRDDAAGRVADQALHQDAAAGAGAEDDGPLRGLDPHGLVGAARADEEPRREHPRDGEGEAGERHAAREVDDRDDQDEEARGRRRRPRRHGPPRWSPRTSRARGRRRRGREPAEGDVHETTTTALASDERGRVLLGDGEVEAQPGRDEEAGHPDARRRRRSRGAWSAVTRGAAAAVHGVHPRVRHRVMRSLQSHRHIGRSSHML